jgi:hypothetical protein
MIRISGYIISLLAILLVVPVMAQSNADLAETDVQLETPVETGLRIGFNLVRPLMVFPVPSRFGMEAVADYNIGHDYFAVAEAGFSNRGLNEPTYHLQEKGMFLRFGADRNLYNHFNDVIGVGARLGVSIYDRGAPLINVEDGYWGDYSGTLATDTFFRQWAEVIFVIKAEIFSNFFLGWNLRGKILLFDGGDRYLDDRYIPGFGAGTSNSTAGFDFYIYYRIPL